MRHLLLLSLLLILGSCHNEQRTESKRVVEQREVRSFSRIVLAGVGNLFVHQGDKEEVQLEADENILRYITTQVASDTLYIEQKPMGWLQSFRSQKPFDVHVYLKEVEEIALSGQGVMQAKSKIKSHTLTIKVSGSQQVDVEMEVDNFTASVTGSAHYRLKGKAANQIIQISGACEYDALQLLSNDTSVDIRGWGQVDVNVQDQLNVIITGGGVVRYKGKPQITQKFFGNGTIEEIKD